jgi:hypothetical protein
VKGGLLLRSGVLEDFEVRIALFGDYSKTSRITVVESKMHEETNHKLHSYDTPQLCTNLNKGGCPQP